MRRGLIVLALAIVAFGMLDDAHAAGRRRAARPARGFWRPLQQTTWQIQFQGPFDDSVDAQLYDLDAFDTPASVVTSLRGRGKRVICYINAGAWEQWRPDAAQFPSSVIGKDYVGWPGEKWLDIRRIDLLAPILNARLDLCAAKGFDGVDPDNLDGYQVDSGFVLSAADQLAFNRFLAQGAHARRLAIGLKNDFDQVRDLVVDFDFAVIESCFHNAECALLTPFLDTGKAVLDIEYTENGTSLSDFCDNAKALKVSAILKHFALDSWIQSCR